MTIPRLLFMAKVAPAVRHHIEGALAQLRLDWRLGNDLFPPDNWHQTLSDRYEDTPEMSARLQRAGARISAHAFTLWLNKIGGREYWSVFAQAKPREFMNLLAAVQDGVMREGLNGGGLHTPHVSVSYNAPEPLPPLTITPIRWHIDEVLLVRGCGDGPNYHYEVIARWDLLPALADQQQPLF